MNRLEFAGARRIVVKIGSSLLTGGGKGLDKSAISALVAQIAKLRLKGVDVVLVSSGAVVEGVFRLRLKVRPKLLHELQAAASVGQMGLVHIYENEFQRFQLHTAQVLLTHEDLSDRQRYLNARGTLTTLLRFGVIPVINENDTVATDEIRFGDNDTLAALVSNLVEADILLMLTDQQGLFSDDPSLNATATLIDDINTDNSLLDRVAGGSRSGLGCGGMQTKIKAARLAARSGTTTVIASGKTPNIIATILSGDKVGTCLYSNIGRFAAKKQWLAGKLQVKGELILDKGAVDVLRQAGKSLLAVGIRAVSGEFSRGDLVSCVGIDGVEIARGLVNYNAEESKLIMGKSSYDFEQILGFADATELIHRDNMVLVEVVIDRA